MPLMVVDLERREVRLGFDGAVHTLTESLPDRETVDGALNHIEAYLDTVDLGQCPDPPFAKASMFEALLYVFYAPFANHDMKLKRIRFGNIDSRGPRFLYIYGPAQNGKSTFLEVIDAMISSYAIKTPAETLMLKRQDGPSNDVTRLKGARFVSSAETQEGRSFDESKLKDLTGGDVVTARFLHREHFEYYPEFKIWMGANHRPVIRGVDEGIWRRIRLVPFEVQIPIEERDPSLKGPNGKLRAELSGILNWALEGCREWQKKGLQPPAGVVNATASYQAEMDVIGQFISDRCVQFDRVGLVT